MCRLNWLYKAVDHKTLCLFFIHSLLEFFQWIVFFEIYFYKNNAQIKQQTKRIIDKKGA